MSTLCPVCGYDLGFEAWKEGNPSFEFCPCCGMQFGYYDFSTTESGRRRQHVEWRERWVREGMKWDDDSQPPPTGWDPVKQLDNLLAHDQESGTSGRPE